MASAATTGFGGDPTKIAYIFSSKLGSRPNSNDVPSVFFVGNDNSEQESLKSLVVREGWQLETLESAREFLGRPRSHVPSCLILTLSPSDLNGLEEQKQIALERAEVPIIVISRYVDAPTIVQVMKAGAVDFLVMPFSDDVLLVGIRESLERSRLAMDREIQISDLRSRYGSLSRRERQVMALVVSGLLNKQVAGELGISEITVKAHRRRAMRKMKANSLPDLVRMAIEIKSARTVIQPT